VRALEKRVALLQRGPRRRRSSQPDVPENHLRDLEEKLQQRLGTAVKVFPSRTTANGKKASGAVEIQYYTADDLDRLMLILGISDEF
jgi:ParB family transcriptional regulator, chromosome partitioning protein